MDIEQRQSDRLLRGRDIFRTQCFSMGMPLDRQPWALYDRFTKVRVERVAVKDQTARIGDSGSMVEARCSSIGEGDLAKCGA